MKASRSLTQALTPMAGAAWRLSELQDDPIRASSRDSRFTVSNGFLGIRGAQAINRKAAWTLPPRTYVAGLFDTASEPGAIPKLVPAPDWLGVRISLDGAPPNQTFGTTSERLTLEMKRGLLLGDFQVAAPEPGAGVTVRILRLISMSERAVGLQLIDIAGGTTEAEVRLEACLEGMDTGLAAAELTPDLGVWRTLHSGKSLAVAVAARLLIDGELLTPSETSQFRWVWTWRSRPGQPVCFERIVAVARGDDGVEAPRAVALDKLDAARKFGWRGLVGSHEAAWAERWAASGIEIRGDPGAERALRFALYHLNGAPNPEDDHVSVGARGLTGDDYNGHVFWDTEIFLLPFFSFTWPMAARALLMYRFRTLPAAKDKAVAMGWRGALYAWESADTGTEAAPAQVVGPDRLIVDVRCGTQEQHISADVAYAVWQYWQVTADDGFLLEAGAEILLETARFWASRAVLEADGRRHIRGVIGPDEYHETIDDNAFTNVMARWNIRRGLEVASVLRERWPAEWARLSAVLGVTEVELKDWNSAAHTVTTGLDPKTGLYEQFEGYFGLEPIDLTAYAGRSVPMDIVLGRERTHHSQVIKQADVVALLALAPEEFPSGAAEANFRYYEPRCGHGSSLSRAMHGLVAARLDRSEEALRFFTQTAAIDLGDAHVAIAGGLHMAALGGLWQMAILGFAGLTLLNDGVALNPQLPVKWKALAFPFQWRGRSLRIRINRSEGSVEASLLSGEPMTLTVCGAPHALTVGQRVCITAKRAASPETRTRRGAPLGERRAARTKQSS